MVKTWKLRPTRARSTPVWLLPEVDVDRPPPAAWTTSEKRSQGMKR
jgi:hypothetical protein